MKKQIQLFFTALMFYTRIPCPKNIVTLPDDLNAATRYYPLVGIIVGALSFLVFWGADFLFGTLIAVVLALAAGVLITGAFHEDGFTDVFDGFGGGWNKEKILEIMKDSRIGAFGTIAVLLLMLLKMVSLWSISTVLSIDNMLMIFLVFITYHSLARLTSGNIVFLSKYARADATSKVKPIEKGATTTEIIIAYVVGLLPLGIFAYYEINVLWVVVPLAFLVFFAKRYFEKHIGGYTGDCLGFTEQVAELIILLYLTALWKFL